MSTMIYSIGSVCVLFKNAPETDSPVQHIKFFSSSADSKANYQALAKEWVLNTGKLSHGGLPRSSLVR